ncbi:MAG: hypothetical protein IK137_00055 [Bacilli bacterium]|nr:hypothetical protein [Bacilli bacterium]
MDIVEFLTSKEIIVVYIIAAVACLLCFVIYLVEKYNDRGRKRHNTKELNKLVEQIKEEVEIVPEEEVSEPVLQVVSQVEEPVIEPIQEVIEPSMEISEVTSPSDEDIRSIIMEISTEVQKELNTEKEEIEILEPEEELEYTTIEPDADVAREELHKITEELKQQEEQVEKVVDNCALTDYEIEQEENAIISLEELVKKSKELYEANELTQYKDEGNEPISISDLEVIAGREAAPITAPFEISTVVNEEEVEDINIENNNTVVEPEIKRFKSSPIISPVYGIEKNESVNELELENTANYEKLDAEIKKTNEFLMTLKELQSKLD